MLSNRSIAISKRRKLLSMHSRVYRAMILQPGFDVDVAKQINKLGTAAETSQECNIFETVNTRDTLDTYKNILNPPHPWPCYYCLRHQHSQVSTDYACAIDFGLLGHNHEMESSHVASEMSSLHVVHIVHCQPNKTYVELREYINHLECLMWRFRNPSP